MRAEEHGLLSGPASRGGRCLGRRRHDAAITKAGRNEADGWQLVPDIQDGPASEGGRIAASHYQSRARVHRRAFTQRVEDKVEGPRACASG